MIPRTPASIGALMMLAGAVIVWKVLQSFDREHSVTHFEFGKIMGTGLKDKLAGNTYGPRPGGLTSGGGNSGSKLL